MILQVVLTHSTRLVVCWMRLTPSHFAENFQKHFRIIEDWSHWNCHGKCIKMSTNKIMFGPLVLQIGCDVFIKKNLSIQTLQLQRMVRISRYFHMHRKAIKYFEVIVGQVWQDGHTGWEQQICDDLLLGHLYHTHFFIHTHSCILMIYRKWLSLISCHTNGTKPCGLQPTSGIFLQKNF